VAATALNTHAQGTSHPFRALFIGNSYTYFNDLPAVVADLAMAANQPRRFEPFVVLVGGATLEAHLARRDALDRIQAGGWDVIVLQEQSTRPIAEPQSMWRDVSAFAGAASRVGAKLVLYETWAREAAPETQDSLTRVYHKAASNVNATVAHVGEAWRAFRDQEGPIAAGSHSALFQPDGSHPTTVGTYLAAAVMYATLYGTSPAGLPGVVRRTTAQPPPGPAPDAPRDSLPAPLARTIQTIAWNVARR
jgi:hypothetical protein